MEPVTCKICFREFSSYRALGGHMRSHKAKPPIQIRASNQKGKDDLLVHDHDHGQNVISSKSVLPLADASVSFTVSEEVESAARTLMELSRDEWTREEASEKEVGNTRASDVEMKNAEEGVVQCPHCPKRFQSGRALGGHVKVHISGAARREARAPGNIAIDLNLPPPE